MKQVVSVFFTNTHHIIIPVLLSNIGYTHSKDHRNTISNIKEFDKTIDKYSFVYPVQYEEKIKFRIIEYLSLFCFGFGMAVFIMLPLVNINVVSDEYVAIISVFAFAVMMLGMFIDEMGKEIQRKYDSIVGEIHFIIRVAFNDFDSYHDQFLFYINDVKAQESQKNT